MKAKNVLKAAAVLAASFSINAQAEISVIKSCLPLTDYDGVKSVTLCDATKVNKLLKLKLNSEGCAVSQETNYADGGVIFEQAQSVEIAGTERAVVKLRECDIDDVGAFMVEL